MLYNDLSLNETSFNSIGSCSQTYICDINFTEPNDYYAGCCEWQNRNCVDMIWIKDRVIGKFCGDISQKCLYCVIKNFFVETASGSPSINATNACTFSINCPNVPVFDSIVYCCSLLPYYTPTFIIANKCTSCTVNRDVSSPFYPNGGTFIISGFNKCFTC